MVELRYAAATALAVSVVICSAGGQPDLVAAASAQFGEGESTGDWSLEPASIRIPGLVSVPGQLSPPATQSLTLREQSALRSALFRSAKVLD